MTLTLVAILFLLGMTTISALYKKNQLQRVTNEITAAIQFAKTQAVLLNKPLILLPISKEHGWSSGFMLFVDNSQHQLPSNTSPIYQWQCSKKNTDVIWHGFKQVDYLIFSPKLRLNVSNGYFIIKNNLLQIKLVLNRLGRVRVVGKWN